MELDGASYLGFNLPFSISQLVWIEALLVGGAEVYRNGATDLEERIYPGAHPIGVGSPGLGSASQPACIVSTTDTCPAPCKVGFE